MHYLVTTRWEERVPGAVTRTILERRVEVESRAEGENLRLVLRTTQPRLRKRDPTAQEQLALRLAALYQCLEVRVTPAGQVLAVLNQEAIAHTWQQLAAELHAYYGPESELLAAIVPAVSQQVISADRLLASLRYDYFYAHLLGRPGSLRTYPEFVDGTSLWFAEHYAPDDVAPPVAGQLRGVATGRLDEARTDRSAVAQQLDAALARHGHRPASPTNPAELCFGSRVRTVRDAATGWPLAVDATINFGSPASGYAKEYDLTIEMERP